MASCVPPICNKLTSLSRRIRVAELLLIVIDKYTIENGRSIWYIFIHENEYASITNYRNP
jgi:hypothetical protein